MEDAAIRFARAARTADVALFYYSGHALQFNGVNYLAPVDTILKDEADLRRMTRVDQIVADLQQAKNLRILILDSCRDNPFAEQLRRSIGNTRAVEIGTGLAKIDAPQGMIMAYATQAGRTAADGTGNNSPYTEAFLKHIEKQEEIGTIFREISEDVYETTKHTQLPELSLSIIGRFYLRGKGSEDAGPSTGAAPPSAVDGSKSDYEAAMAVDTVAAWEAFLKQHAEGFYADLARERKAKIEKEIIEKDKQAALVPPKPPSTSGAPRSEREEQKYIALARSAGDGNRGALDQLTRDADGGNITAQALLAYLYDPAWAVDNPMPNNPVKPDAAKALKLYQPAADLGYKGSQRGMTELLLSTSWGVYDFERGCQYGAALYSNPEAIKEKFAGFESAIFFTAGCYVNEASGFKRDLDKVAEMDMLVVAMKYKNAVNTFTNNLGKTMPGIIAAIQRNLRGRGLYNGPDDGQANPQTIAAVRTLAGQAGSGTSPPPANLGNPYAKLIQPDPQPDNPYAKLIQPDPQPGNPYAKPAQPVSDEQMEALFGRAAKDVGVAEKLCSYADAGDARAELYCAAVFDPNHKMDRKIPTDARRAVTYYRRLAAKNIGAAAASAAFLYDIGYPELPRDPEEAAALIARSLELKDKETVTSLERDSWRPGFWAALQRQLARRGLYIGNVVDQKNDRTMMAVRKLAGADL